MQDLDELFFLFKTDVQFLVNFIRQNFGDKDILRLKNKGGIPKSDYNVKGSRVKSYSFHGYGCTFSFKGYSVDIEFSNDDVGFTSWSFYLFAKKSLKELEQWEVEQFLKHMEDLGKIKYSHPIYII